MRSFVAGLLEAFGATSLVGLSDALLAVAADASEAFAAERIASWSSTRAGVDLDVALSEPVVGVKETVDGWLSPRFLERYHRSGAVQTWTLAFAEVLKREIQQVAGHFVLRLLTLPESLTLELTAESWFSILSDDEAEIISAIIASNITVGAPIDAWVSYDVIDEPIVVLGVISQRESFQKKPKSVCEIESWLTGDLIVEHAVEGRLLQDVFSSQVLLIEPSCVSCVGGYVTHGPAI